MKEFLLNLLSGTLEQVGESKLKEVLQNLHDSHPDQYKAAIYGGAALVNGLRKVVEASATKIDDAIVKAIDEAIKESAVANGITDLPVAA